MTCHPANTMALDLVNLTDATRNIVHALAASIAEGDFVGAWDDTTRGTALRRLSKACKALQALVGAGPDGLTPDDFIAEAAAGY